MNQRLKKILQEETAPRRGFFAIEWVMFAYVAFTFALLLVFMDRIPNPGLIFWWRFTAVAGTFFFWALYRIYPCPLTRFLRFGLQVTFLAKWYPDLYEFNRIFPNLDHVFAGIDQKIFGMQPSLGFSEWLDSGVVSELMYAGYFSYFPMLFALVIFYFFYRYKESGRAAVVILAAFFIYYIVFLFVPVAGPQYYYPAVGVESIREGIFPEMGTWFNDHRERLVAPGWKDGIFYTLVEMVRSEGERPSAAFPSSHVGVSTVIMLLALHSKSKPLFFSLLPLYLLLCLATVYIHAHYLTDAIAGLVSGVAIYFLLMALSKKAVIKTAG